MDELAPTYLQAGGVLLLARHHRLEVRVGARGLVQLRAHRTHLLQEGALQQRLRRAQALIGGPQVPHLRPQPLHLRPHQPVTHRS
eukprot:924326-Prorocentrum_minimum.AAC.1